MATHCSILAWRILWTEESGGLQSTVLQSRTRLGTHTVKGSNFRKRAWFLQATGHVCCRDPPRVAKLSDYKQEAQFRWNFRLAAEGPQLPLNTASLRERLRFLCSAPSLPNRGSLQLWLTGGIRETRDNPPFSGRDPSAQVLQECCSEGSGSSRAPGGELS